MRRATSRGLASAATLLALGAAVLPGTAGAASFEPNIEIHLERGRYDIGIGNLGETVVLAVETGALQSQRRVATTSYAVHGTATDNRLEADFGKLGEIEMRFHPSSNRSWEKPHRNCRGLGALLVRRGTWQGKLRFRGEGGYLSLDLHRVRGVVQTIAPKCRKQQGARKRSDSSRRQSDRSGRQRGRNGAPGVAEGKLVEPSQEPELGPEVPVLQASWRKGVFATEFVGGSSKEGSVFYAATQEARGRVAVFRSARAEAKRKAVTANNALTRAKLTPPWPFHRSASYRAAPDGSRTWSGYLSVFFPGAPRYPLTGEPFKPSLNLFPELLVGLIGLFKE